MVAETVGIALATGNRSDALVSSLTSACLEKLKTTADDCYRRFHVSDFGRDYVPPYCLRFATTAMGGHALVSTDEEGMVTVFDTRKPMLAAGSGSDCVLACRPWLGLGMWLDSA